MTERRLDRVGQAKSLEGVVETEETLPLKDVDDLVVDDVIAGKRGSMGSFTVIHPKVPDLCGEMS